MASAVLISMRVIFARCTKWGPVTFGLELYVSNYDLCLQNDEAATHSIDQHCAVTPRLNYPLLTC